MKKILTIIMLMATLMGTAFAQNALNSKSDNIVGIYLGTQGEVQYSLQ